MDATPAPNPVPAPNHPVSETPVVNETSAVNEPAAASSEELDTLLDRINVLSNGGSPSGGEGGGLAPEVKKPNVGPDGAFYPREPSDYQEAGISKAVVEELVCKYLLAIGEASIRQISDQVALPFLSLIHI